MPFAADGQVTLGTEALPEPYASRITALWVDRVASGISSARFTLASPGGDWAGAKLLLDGGPVTLSLTGRSQARVEVFQGEVVGLRQRQRVEGGAEIECRCADKLHRLGRREGEAVYLDLTDGELLRHLVTPFGLRGKAEGLSVVYPTIFQAAVTPLALLVERAARIGFSLWIEGDVVHLAQERSGGDRALSIEGDLLALRISQSAAQVAPKATVRGWDAATKRATLAEAAAGEESADDAGRPRGSETVKGRLKGEPRLIHTSPPASPKDAEAMAKGQLAELSQRWLTAHGRMPGEPTLSPGDRLTLEHVAPGARGAWRVARVQHRINEGGFITEFEARRNVGGAI